MTNSTNREQPNVSKKLSKTSLVSKVPSQTSVIGSLITKTPKASLQQDSSSMNNSVAPARDSKAIKLNKLASKMESILEDLPPDRNIEPKRKTLVDTVASEIAAQTGVKAFNKQIGKVKRDGHISEKPKSSKLERIAKNKTDQPEQKDHFIYSVDEAASASMGTRKATQAFSSSSKIKLPAQNKCTIAEIPPYSPIKESVVRDKLSNLNKSIMEDWISQSEPEPDFRDNSNLLGKSPRKKKKKKSSKKGAKNESDIWSDNNNNPGRVPESVIHENLNTLNRSIIEEWQSENETRGREEKWPYKVSPRRKKKKSRPRSGRSRSRSRSRSRKRKQKKATAKVEPIDGIELSDNPSKTSINSRKSEFMENFRATVINQSGLRINEALSTQPPSEVASAVVVDPMDDPDYIPEDATLYSTANDGNLEVMKRLVYKMQDAEYGLTTVAITNKKSNSSNAAKSAINQPDEDGLTALHHASKTHHSDCIKFLIQNGADPTIKGAEECLPIHIAAKHKGKMIRQSTFVKVQSDRSLIEQVTENETTEDLETTMRLLLDKMIELKGREVIDQGDTFGDTALHYAVTRSSQVAAEILLEYGANVNLQNKQRLTPICLASKNGDLDLLPILLEKGADFSIRDEERATALHIAAKEGHLDYLDMCFASLGSAELKVCYGTASDKNVIMQRALSDVDRRGANILHYAVESENPDLVKYLINQMEIFNLKRRIMNSSQLNGNTALHIAAETGCLEVAKELIKSGARIDSKNSNKETPLFMASKHNNLEVIKFLTKRSSADFLSNSLLISAAQGHIDVTKVLLDNGASYGEKDKHDRSLVFIAAMEGHEKYLHQILLRPQARSLINLRDSQQNTACHIAAQRGHARVCAVLIANGADVRVKNHKDKTPMHFAVEEGHDRIVRLLHQADHKLVQDADENLDLPIHKAAINAKLKCARLLIELESEINTPNGKGATPLALAAHVGAHDVCKELIMNNADVDFPNRAKVTPLHLAAKNGHPNVVTLLIKSGANVNLGADEGRNCLDYAIDYYQEACVEAILKSDTWDKALQSATMDEEGTFWTPMRKLIEHMPNSAEFVFNKCIKIFADKEEYSLATAPRKAFEADDFVIRFRYEFLDDDYKVRDWYKKDAKNAAPLPDVKAEAKRRQSMVDKITIALADLEEPKETPYSADSRVLKLNHPLNKISNLQDSNCHNLTLHPLVTSLYNAKWKRIGFYFYYGNLFLYLIFMLLFNIYCITLPPPYTYDQNSESNCTVTSQQAVYPIANQWYDSTDGTGCYDVPLYDKPFKWILLILSLMSLSKEIFQVVYDKWEYFFDVANYVEWALYICTILFLVDNGSETPEAKEHWQWKVGSFAIWLSWMELLLLIQKLPKVGIYVLMFENVLKTFKDFAFIGLVFLLGFSISFFMLTQNQAGFATVGQSFVKSLAMMIGEFDMGDIFDQLGVNSYTDCLAEDGDCDDTWGVINFYSNTAYVMFVVFVVIMTIILNNMLVGLAIDDIKSVQSQAVLLRKAMKIGLALDVWYRAPGDYRYKLTEDLQDGDACMMALNPPTTWREKLEHWFDPMEITREKIRGLQIEKTDEIESLDSKVQQLASKINGVEHMIESIVTHFNIRLGAPKSDTSLL